VGRNAWRHPWQVVRCLRNHAVVAVCSHRFEVTAGWCARLRFDTDRWHHDVRRTPGHDVGGRA